MANLSSLNRILKFQKLLLPLNCQNYLQATSIESNTNALAVLIRHQRTPCRTYAREINKFTLSRPTTNASQSYYSLTSSSRNSSSSSASSSDPPRTADQSPAINIDEFRKREEEREQEFERLQAAKESKEKADAEDAAKRAKVEIIRQKILAAALKHVRKLGWTRQAIVQGAEDVGLPSVVHGMFPEGGFALVAYFTAQCNEKLLKKMQKETEMGQQIPGDPIEFLTRCVRTRLEMIAPYKMHWPQAIGLNALPQNASTALAQVLTLVDDICYYSGDRSVDMGWYTRRIGLATIMKMTELFMLQDSSTEHAKTWEFLRNRMDEAVQLQMMLSESDNMKHNLQRSFNSAFITARNILGLGYNR